MNKVYKSEDLGKLAFDDTDTSKYTFAFKDGEAEKTFDKIGEQEVILSVTLSDGTMEEWSLTVTVEDTTAPVFRGISHR